ncbi:MAG: signal peptidase I [Bacteroidota bacterium]|nr:signal peptidase I [Bacteroidota bacterium]
MTIIEWVLFFFLLQIIHFLGTWKLYRLSGEKSWKAIVPVYNAIVLMKIIRYPKWWVILLFFPVINLLMFVSIWIGILRSFGRHSLKEDLLCVISFGFYIYLINYNKATKYCAEKNDKPKSALEEWVGSITFAVIAATLVHNYIFQPFIIPTGSLEKSLLIGDFLIVSKFHYGARIPSTTLAFPMVHDTLPIIKTRSYLKKPQLPYFRLPKIKTIKRNDIVVFNWPADTVRQFFKKEKGVKKPIDKKSNYVKRCLGLPGDTLEIKDGLVYNNGELNILPERAKIQYSYTAYSKKGISSKDLLSMEYKNFTRRFRIQNITESSYNQLKPYILGSFNDNSNNFLIITKSSGLPIDLVRKLGLRIMEIKGTTKELVLTNEEFKKIKNVEWLDSIERNINKIKTANQSFFPNKIPFNWNQDNFGPIIIPKSGQKINLNLNNLPLYKKIIKEYENNTLSVINGEIIINNLKADGYEFKQDYYWMMGDNRHRSEDSRFWGFVPSDHIVGKPVFIWFSIEGINDGIKNWKIRWERVFTTVGGKGERTSYLPHFILFILAWQAYAFYRKKRLKK